MVVWNELTCFEPRPCRGDLNAVQITIKYRRLKTNNQHLRNNFRLCTETNDGRPGRMLIKAIATLARFIKPYPYVIPAIAILGVLTAVFEALAISLLMPFLSSLTESNVSSGGLVMRWLKSYGALFPEAWQSIAVGGSISLLFTLSCIASVFYLRVLCWASTQTTYDLRQKLFDRFLHSKELFLEEGSQGRQIKIIDGACQRAGQAVMSFCLLCANACIAVIILAFLFLISWRMTFIVLLGVAMTGLVVRLFIERGMGISKAYEQSANRLNDVTVSVLSGLRTVRIFGQEEHEIHRFNSVSRELQRSHRKLEVARRSMAPLIDGISIPLLVAAMIVATYANISVIVLLPFLLLVFRLQRYVRECDVMRVHIASDAGAIFEVAQLLESIPPVLPDKGDHVSKLRHSIDFRSVSFAHQNVGPNSLVIDNLDLTIERGETVGIVGESGSGKSTIINLVCGIYTPLSGAILIDGQDLSTLNLAQWRRRVSFSGQDGDLIAGSIFENISYARRDASMQDVIEASKSARAHSFISLLPEAYNTTVGVRGMQLSGGERQRIALARALIRKPDVLILDEATNAVDNETEAEISAALQSVKGQMTTIVIAHRLSSVANVDRVIVMSKGKIVEQGTPEALLGNRGAYARLQGFES